jgi:hypothetical protein
MNVQICHRIIAAPKGSGMIALTAVVLSKMTKVRNYDNKKEGCVEVRNMF